MKKQTWLKILGIIGIIAVLTGLGILQVLPLTASGTTPPTVTTDAATFTTKSGAVSAVFNGSETVGSYKVSVWFDYGLSTDYGSKTAAVAKSTPGTFSATVLTNLTPGVTYDYRADLKYGSTTITGDNETVTVGSLSGGTGQIYTDITVADGDTLTINNDVLCSGDITIGDGASLTINGDCNVAKGVYINGGQINIYGDLKVMDSLTSTDISTGCMQIQGNCYVGQDLNMSGGFSISGDLYVAGAMAGMIVNASSAVNGKVIVGNNGNGGLTVNAPFACGWLTTYPESDIHVSDGGYMYVGSVDCGGNFNAASSGVTLDIVGDCKVAGGFSLGDGTSADTCTITGTAYFYGGYTLASGSNLTVGNMPTLNPVTTTAP